MSSWLKIGAEWIKTLTGQWNDASDLNVPGKANDSSAVEDSETVADGMMAQLESQRSINLKGYWEFATANRAAGWNTWLTFAISPAAEQTPKPTTSRPMFTK